MPNPSRFHRSIQDAPYPVGPTGLPEPVHAPHHCVLIRLPWARAVRTTLPVRGPATSEQRAA